MGNESFFEGAEKKIELSLVHGAPSLRAMGTLRIDALVHAANAKVVSRLQTRGCDAYILSESSLFVFDDFLVMITCGQSSLIKSALMLLDEVSHDQIQYFSYKRQKEIRPELQSTEFEDDVLEMGKTIPGECFEIGSKLGRSTKIFLASRSIDSRRIHPTIEVQMLAEDASWDLSELTKGFSVSDHRFEPHGYSLNAVLNDEYFTVHVTPQAKKMYVSFHGSFASEKIDDILSKVISCFKPSKHDAFITCSGGGSKMEGYSVPKISAEPLASADRLFVNAK